ncbi:uncharacterized protein K452DRAFT_15593 [Aplosporella prunicola CBS 121167]|uniref:Uncharacterized protein n=1 Tax=Aplosporella prunicola CBS 121167 TaxID=1176127 RepID=A0A6A6BKK3_9PEZI|nr:uncharacterized protein K452DRAFT_15593 [Aplosporella prunicola CBS 121167]KAF2143101.1 hypothetical protein K452DRAFT_15593 [Aplosporella prunicola CBS 121167]
MLSRCTKYLKYRTHPRTRYPARHGLPSPAHGARHLHVAAPPIIPWKRNRSTEESSPLRSGRAACLPWASHLIDWDVLHT